MYDIYILAFKLLKSKVNNEYTYGDNSSVITVLYHVTWCPYSKKD